MSTVRMSKHLALMFYFLIFFAFSSLSRAEDTSVPPTSFSETFKTNTVIQADRTIDGNVKLTSGTLDLQGKTLTINGALIHSGGTLNVNGGKLIVTGDYRLQTPTEEGYTSSEDVYTW